MEFPKWVYDIVVVADRSHPSNIPAATDKTETDFWSHSEHEELIKQMVRRALQDLVYERRHAIDREIRKEAGVYGPPAKHAIGCDVVAAYKSLYEYRIAGTMLGLLYISELGKISTSEHSKAVGYEFNAILTKKLDMMAPKNKRDKMVKEVFSEATIRKIFLQIKSEQGIEAA